jgi:small-conductance mechanosensitive channel
MMTDQEVQGLWGQSVAWGEAALLVAGAVVAGLLVYALAHRLLRTVTRGRMEQLPLRGALLKRVRGPLRLLCPLLALYVARPLVESRVTDTLAEILGGGMHALFVAAVTWLIVALLFAVEEAIAERYSVDQPNNLKARKIVTQARILRRIVTTVVVVLAVGVVLLEYEPFWELGTGILASAGVFGIIFGIAAQQTLGNLIAGIQIAFTQPIRVDDVVIVEGEFGWIEEITLTYVVVRVWDRRRIVLPITHFVTQPFQNWTRTSSDLIGAVFVQADYTVPVDAVREKLQEVVAASEKWDGDVCHLQVTDASERTVTLRAIASAPSAPDLWDLRCEIREALVTYLREEHPDALPAVRTRVQDPDAPGEEDAPRPPFPPGE